MKIDYFSTIAGQKFTQGTVPRLIRAIEALNDSARRMTEQVEEVSRQLEALKGTTDGNDKD